MGKAITLSDPIGAGLILDGMDTRPDPIIANAWHELAQLAGELSAALRRAGANMSAGLRRQIARDLRLAEALARRAIVLMAAALDLPAPTAKPVRSSSRRRGQNRRPAKRGFVLFEPLWRVPGAVTVEAPQPQPTVDTSDLSARLEVLGRVLANPNHYARRLAGLQARRREKRVSPLRPGPQPGCAGRRLDDWLLLTLGDLHARALRVVYRAWQPAPG